MMPNIDPRTLKNMMDKMGIKSSEVKAESVSIKCEETEIIISNPQVMKIQAQGNISFQISGDVSEIPREVEAPEITEDDIKTVMEKSGTDDFEKAKSALLDSNGDIAEAIIRLKSSS